MNESDNAITRFELDPAQPVSPEQKKALAQRLKRAVRHAANYSDITELPDEWFLRAARDCQLPAKKPISIKLDEDVLDYFKGAGRCYQMQINGVPRANMQARRRTR